MSITVNLYYTGKNGAARAFANEMLESGTVDLIRQEEGNLKYEYFSCIEDEQTILLIDSWKDQASIDVHHQSPMMKTIFELREKYDLHMRMERFISQDDIPAQDQEFIRK